MQAALTPTDATAMLDAMLELLDASGALVNVKDATTGAYLFVNAAMAQVIGRPAPHILGATDAQLLPLEEAGAVRQAEEAALKSGAAHSKSDLHFDRGGIRRDYRTVRTLMPGDGGVQRLLSVWWDDTDTNRRANDLQRALQQIEQQQAAFESLRKEQPASDDTGRDTPTGLFQRAHFEDQLRREVDLSVREHREFALVLIAMDTPAAAGAALGDAARQRVLSALGQLLRANTRAMDAPCRLGPELFAVLLSGVGLATAHARMEGLRRQCATQIVAHNGQQLGFSVSMGVASFPHTAASLDALSAAAEGALHEAQRRGGNRVTLASIRLDAVA